MARPGSDAATNGVSSEPAGVVAGVAPLSASGPPARRPSTAGAFAQEALTPGRLLSLVTFVALALVTYKHVRSGELEHFILWIQADPLGTLPWFLLFHTLSVVLLFPAMLLQVLSGALYGLYMGAVVSWLSTSIGQALAFLLGRYLFRRPVKAYLVQRVPNFPQIEAAIKKEGWKLMCLLRLSPVLPYNVLNYAAALTPISFTSYTLSSSAAIVPWTCLYTYLGTLSTSVADLVRGRVTYPTHHTSTGVQVLSSLLYILLLTVTIVYGYVLSKRAITSLLKDVADQGPGSQADICDVELQKG